MSDENTENNNEGQNAGAGVAPAKENENPFTWEFEGKTYDLFLANKTGGIAMPILKPPAMEKTMGIIGAKFAWEHDKVFIDLLNQETIDKAKSRTEWTDRENEQMILKNAEFYADTIQLGYSIDIDEFGNRSEEKPKNYDGMMRYRKPVQSDLVNQWLNKQIHIERWLPPGMTSIDALLADVDEVFFTLKIGDYENPRHLIFTGFTAPNDESISAYVADTFKRGQNDVGDWRHTRDNLKRLNFARKYLNQVQGAMLSSVTGEFDITGDQLEIIEPKNPTQLARFKEYFNPAWMVKLGDELAGAFNLGK